MIYSVPYGRGYRYYESTTGPHTLPPPPGPVTMFELATVTPSNARYIGEGELCQGFRARRQDPATLPAAPPGGPPAPGVPATTPTTSESGAGGEFFFSFLGALLTGAVAREILK
jgi:hypothetical protein